MKTVTVKHPMGREEVVALVETYRGFNIVKYTDGPDCIMVHDPRNETLFVVGLDDSKSSGRRIFNEKDNTVQAAKDYIDHTIEWRASALVRDLRKANEPLFQEFKKYLAKNYREWKEHPTEQDIATIRWFCHQSEKEQLGYLLAFLDQRNGGDRFDRLKDIVVNEFKQAFIPA